jgi:hypothetical protein
MTYCTNCGKQNLDTAKFCVACGTLLKVTTQQPAHATVKPDTENEKIFGAPAKKRKTIWIIIAIIGFLGLVSGAYFLFFDKKGNNFEEKKVEMVDTIRLEPVYQNNATPAVDSPPPTYPATSNAVPLNPGNTNEQVTITQTEVDEISQVIKDFYQCENNEDISCLLNRYSFPVSRYYQLYNVSYEDLHRLFTESFTEKLSYHRITLKWDYCTIQKIGDGYKAVVYADYEFIRSATPDENRSRSIQIIIYFNSAYQITSIYENQ